MQIAMDIGCAPPTEVNVLNSETCCMGNGIWRKRILFTLSNPLFAHPSRPNALTAAGLSVTYGTCPEIDRQQAYKDHNVSLRHGAKRLDDTSLAFDVHHRMDRTDLEDNAHKVADIIRSST